MTPNGTAVEGVNVTRRSHPATRPGSLDGICPGGKEGMARVFAVQVQILLYAGAIAVQVLEMTDKLSRYLKVCKRLPAQCRDVNCLGARYWSLCRILIAGRCGSPGLLSITYLSR
jgi:hypothetical protein